MEFNYADYDALGLADLIKQKEITPEEALASMQGLVEKLNPKLNAIIHPMSAEIAQQLTALNNHDPDAIFYGVPFLLKDLMANYGGVPTSYGSQYLKNHPAKRDSELVIRYKHSGLIIAGKTNVPEFGLGATTDPKAFGKTINPWSEPHSPGGSSGGSASAVAAGIVPMAHGNDGGGSIRIPAACCGLFGLKPSRGRNPTGPDGGKGWQGFVVEHVITRSVRDSAAALDATAGMDQGAPFTLPTQCASYRDEVEREPGKLRIAFTSKPFFSERAHLDCINAVNNVAKLCEDLGHHVEQAQPDIFSADIISQAYITLVSSEVAATISRYVNQVGRPPKSSDFEPVTDIFRHLGKVFTGEEFAKASFVQDMLMRQIAGFFENYDILLTPTLGMPPMLHKNMGLGPLQEKLMPLMRKFPVQSVLRHLVKTQAEKSFMYVPFTPLFNMTGNPAMSVPLVWNDNNIPIGCQFVAPMADEALLFRLAGQLEQARPWANRKPEIWAGDYV